MNERKIQDYWPEIIRRSPCFKAIAEGCQEALEQIWKDARGLLDEQFIDSASPETLSRWEGMLGTPSFENRREAILSRLRESPPYTLDSLARALEVIAGGPGLVMFEMTEPYTLRVLAAADVSLGEIAALLARSIPANIAYTVGPLHTTQGVLGKMRHSELAIMTHDYIQTYFSFEKEK